MNNKHGILIVEDDRFQSHLLKMLLNSLNYDVVGTTDTGEEAIRLATELKPALIFMDIALAGKIDGIEAAAKIKETSNVSIIYLTSNSDTVHRKRAEEIGYDDYLIKPINKAMVADALVKCLT